MHYRTRRGTHGGEPAQLDDAAFPVLTRLFLLLSSRALPFAVLLGPLDGSLPLREPDVPGVLERVQPCRRGPVLVAVDGGAGSVGEREDGTAALFALRRGDVALSGPCARRSAGATD